MTGHRLWGGDWVAGLDVATVWRVTGGDVATVWRVAGLDVATV